MRRVLVTGANKGIGLAIVEAILSRGEDTFVYLASRDEARGREAAAALTQTRPAWKTRLEVVPLDVASDRSVAEAAARVREHAGGEALYGIVNNAGLGVGGGDLAAVLGTNTLGVHRVVEAFLPLLTSEKGRVVNVTSASGPLFVASCSPERQRFFLDASTTWPLLRALVDDCVSIAGDAAAFTARGLAEGNAYGLSKACTNLYTMIVAREHPRLVVNACTPGFIATDLTRGYAESSGKSAEELGMKPPSEGAKAPLHLLFAELEGNGHYYGSDSKRSPLDRYRAPGSPEYTGS